MLNAVIRNKVGRGLFPGNEDSLTSFIFEKLNYLPKELFKYILIESIDDDTNTFPSDIDFNDIESIEYWPHWDPKYTANTNFVEPDVFIRHKEYDFIIEAKRWDKYQQKKEQWEKELTSYFNEYAEKKVIFIALGGIWDEKTGKINAIKEGKKEEVKIYKCKWNSILKNIKLLKDNIEKSANFLSSNRSVQNIFSDMILTFAVYGFSVADWFQKFEYRVKINQNSIDKLLLWKEWNFSIADWFQAFEYREKINQDSIDKLPLWKL